MIENRKFNIPIVFVFFNRAKITEKNLKEILQIKPKKIYLLSDGTNNKIEKKKIIKLRLKIENKLKSKKINFIRIYSQNNLGSEKNLIFGLNKVFTREKKAIIIEDDCIVDKTFYQFAKKILNIYKNNKSIWGVSAQTFTDGYKKNYYLSKYAHCWGWATWSDRWNSFDYKMRFWKSWSKGNFWNNKNNYIDYIEQIFWKNVYDNVYLGIKKSWNYKWQSFIWKKNGYFIHPHINLVENIGFSNFSSNTKKISKKILFRKKQKINNFYYQNKLRFNKNDDVIIFDKIYFSLNYIIINNLLDFLRICFKIDILFRIFNKIKLKLFHD